MALIVNHVFSSFVINSKFFSIKMVYIVTNTLLCNIFSKTVSVFSEVISDPFDITD